MGFYDYWQIFLFNNSIFFSDNPKLISLSSDIVVGYQNNNKRTSN